eukprot:TRINITY_DN8716_c0_g1_i1.p1 TRINITY_DN8716_c0_g1~~TRINITY_DN8716_c0_g1_i1.p1  ORF type:complete len:426 (+),score=70.08 TRINITY_DN8716_c0_g1_i1:45-1322(+)
MTRYNSGYGGFENTAWERYSISRTSRDGDRDGRDTRRSRTSVRRPRHHDYEIDGFDRRSRSLYHTHRYEDETSSMRRLHGYKYYDDDGDRKSRSSHHTYQYEDDTSPVRRPQRYHDYEIDGGRGGGFDVRSRSSYHTHQYEDTSPMRNVDSPTRTYRSYDIERGSLQRDDRNSGGDFSKFLQNEIEKTRRDNEFLSREISHVKQANLMYDDEPHYVTPQREYVISQQPGPRWKSPQTGTPVPQEAREVVPVPHRKSFESGASSRTPNTAEVRSPLSADICTDTATLEKEALYLDQLNEDNDLMCRDDYDPTSCSTVSTDCEAEAAIREQLVKQEDIREHNLTKMKMQSRAVTLLTSLIRSIHQRSGEMAVCPVDGKQIHKHDYNAYIDQVVGTPQKEFLDLSRHSNSLEVFNHNYEALRMYSKHR